MSISHYVYVGPYIAVPHAVQRVSGPVLAQCTGNPKHQVGQYMKFCPDCGRPVRVTKSEDLKPSSVDVYNIAGDSVVWKPDLSFKDTNGAPYDVWISNNRSLYGGRYLHDDNGDIIDTLENEEVFRGELTRFQGAVQFIVNDIREQYGVEATVRHGIVTYWS